MVVSGEKTFLDFFTTISSKLLEIFDYLSYSYRAFTNAILGIFPGGPLAYKVHKPSKDLRPVLLITGTSTGIGNELAIRSALDGYTVVAGVRREVDAKQLLSELEVAKLKKKKQNLNKSGGGDEYLQENFGEILPLILDVTSPSHIVNARKYIEQITTERGVPFAGLINNAGVGSGKPLEMCSREEMLKLYEVNLFGPFDLIRQLLPLLRRDLGRIINVGSIMGELYVKLGGGYCGTKAAMRAMTAALRQELRAFEVCVVLISPGAIKSQIFGKAASAGKKLLADGHKNKEHDFVGPNGCYEKSLRYQLNTTNKVEVVALPPSHVYQAVKHAMTSRFPSTTYHVGWDSRIISSMVSLLSERLIEMIMAAGERVNRK